MEHKFKMHVTLDDNTYQWIMSNLIDHNYLQSKNAEEMVSKLCKMFNIYHDSDKWCYWLHPNKKRITLKDGITSILYTITFLNYMDSLLECYY